MQHRRGGHLRGGIEPITCAGGSQTLSGSANSATATCKVTYNSSAGSPHSITAVYVPGSYPNYTARSPVEHCQLTVGTTAASTSLGASTTSPAVGQLVTYTATVSGPTNGATPTGSVTFEDGSNPITCTGGDQTLSGSANTATATCQVTYTSTSRQPALDHRRLRPGLGRQLHRRGHLEHCHA